MTVINLKKKIILMNPITAYLNMYNVDIILPTILNLAYSH